MKMAKSTEQKEQISLLNKFLYTLTQAAPDCYLAQDSHLYINDEEGN